MTRRRLAASAVLAFAMVGLSPAFASADTTTPSPSGYAAANASLSLSAGVTVSGKAIVVSGTGFGGGETVDITVTYGAKPKSLGSGHGGIVVAQAAYVLRPASGPSAPVLAYANADSTGAFSQRVTLSQVGTATITATGATSGISRSSVVTIRAATVVPSNSKAKAMPFGWTTAVIFAVVAIVIMSLIGTMFARRRSVHAPTHAPTYAPDDVPAPMA